MTALAAILTTAMVTAVLSATAVGADEIVLNPVNDNTLFQHDQGDLSNGSGSHLFAGTTNSGQIRRALIAFDITSGVPTGSIVTGVSLTMNMSRTISSDHTVELRRVLSNWGEGESAAVRNEGGGTAAAPGDATWVHTYFDGETWSEPGGDFSSTVSASAVVGDTGSYTWESTSESEEDVQSWYDDPSTNYGWILIGAEEADGTAKRFDSRENLDEAVRPQLRIEYEAVTAVAEQSWGGVKKEAN